MSTPTQSYRAQLEKARSHPYFKPALIAIATLGGAYLATRSALKQITDDVHHIAEGVKNVDHNLYSTSQHVIDEVHFQQEYRAKNRDAVRRAKNEDLSFEYYPGLGTLIDHGKPLENKES